jgi:flagellar assembly protein FliH
MSNYIPKEKLSAYERWELAAFDEQETAARQKTATATAASASRAAPAAALPAVSEEELKTIRAEAFAAGKQAGYEDGFKAGQTSGYQDGLQKAAAETAKLAAAAEAFTGAVLQIEAQIADELLALAVDIAQQVVRSSLRVKPELIMPTVREAIAALANPHGHPVLVLNPDDAALVRQQLSEQLAHTPWRIIEDPSIERGGCRVESGGSEVNATVGSRWQRVVEQFGLRTAKAWSK